MLWSRRFFPRVAVVAVLGLASIAGAGDLALPDEHYLSGGDSSVSHFPAVHGIPEQQSAPSQDSAPEHTCHCVHAHGMALISLIEPFRVQVPVRTIPAEFVVSVAVPATAPPFHPPKSLS